MEALIVGEVLDFIVEYTLHELTLHMMEGACLWSKRKVKRIIKRINGHKSERKHEIIKRLKSMDSQQQLNILDYCVKIKDESTKLRESAI